MKRQGFTLIECLVAMTLLTLIALLTSHVALQSYTSLRTLYTKAHMCMMHNAALDLLLYDLKRAPAMKRWLTSDKTNEYAWKQGSDTIKWYIKDTTLMRSNGKRANTVAFNISSLKIAENNRDTFVVSLHGNGKNNFEQVVRVLR